MKRLLSILAFVSVALFGTLAMAQVPDDFPVELVQPEGWTVDHSDQADGRVIAYVDQSNDNRIEILSRQVVRDEHATALFDEFNKQLGGSGGFKVRTAPQEKTVELAPGQSRKGTWAEYEFTSTADVPIYIVTFAYTVSKRAIILVGYFAKENYDAGLGVFNTTIDKMVDKAAE